MKNQQTLGLIAGISASVLAGSSGLFVRHIDANAYVITFVRLALGFVFLMGFLWVTGQRSEIRLRQLSAALVLAGVCLSMTILCYTQAIIHTTLVKAVFLLYLGPLIAVVVASFWLKEKNSTSSLLFLLVAFIGALLLLEFDFSFEAKDSLGYLWGGGAALCYASYILMNRKVSGDVPVFTSILIQFFLGALVLLPVIELDELTQLDPTSWPWLVGVGFFPGFLAISLTVTALRSLQTLTYGTISYLDPLAASMLGYLVYAEGLTAAQFTGCAAIAAAGLAQVFLAKQGDSLK